MARADPSGHPVTFGGGFAVANQRRQSLDIAQQRTDIERDALDLDQEVLANDRAEAVFSSAVAPLDEINTMLQDDKEGVEFAKFLQTDSGANVLRGASDVARRAFEQNGMDSDAVESKIRLVTESARFKAGRKIGLDAVMEEYVAANQRINPAFTVEDISPTTIAQFAGIESGAFAKTIETLRQAAEASGLDPDEAVPFEFIKSLAVSKSKGMSVNVGTFSKDAEGNTTFTEAGAGPLVKQPGAPTANLLAGDREKVSQLQRGLRVAENLLQEFEKDPTRFAVGGAVTKKVAGGLDVLGGLADLTLKALPEELEKEARDLARDIGVTEPGKTSEEFGDFGIMEFALVDALARATNPDAERITDDLRKAARAELNLRGLFTSPGGVRGRLKGTIDLLKDAEAEAMRIGEQNAGGTALTPKFQPEGDLPSFSSSSDPGFAELPSGAAFIDATTGKKAVKQ